MKRSRFTEEQIIGFIKQADAGKNGQRIDGRESFQWSMRDVESGSTDFSIILVYAVSRWGRFQDTDESTYCAYQCRRAGIQVAYCAKQFEDTTQ
jgi:DNA invertase Pin-like site-specific DNA recombinase